MESLSRESSQTRLLHALQILQLSISAGFLAFLPFSLRSLRKAPPRVFPNWRGALKLAIGILLFLSQLASLSQKDRFSSFFLASAIVSAFATLGVCVLIYLNHNRSVRPSDLIIVYLLGSIAVRVAQLQDIYSSHRFQWFYIYNSLTAIEILLSFLLLSFECQAKTRILREPYNLPPEELSSLLGRTFFTWINPILARGSKQFLSEDDIPTLDAGLEATHLRRVALRAWDQRSKPEGTLTLPLTLLKCFYGPFMLVVLPRLALALFRYAQPLLIKYAVRYAMLEDAQESNRSGFWLIVAAFVTYSGLAISTTMYQHLSNRLKLMTRGALVALVYNKSLLMKEDELEDGRAVTLMGNDTDNLVESAKMFHDTWGFAVEVAIGITMLTWEIGWLSPVPLVIIFFCSRVSRWVAQHLHPRQKAWNAATQQRLAWTGSMLGSMKSLKMLGVSEDMSRKVQDLRNEELRKAQRVRWLMGGYNASANALGIFAPVIALILFAVVTKLRGFDFETETIFATTAILKLVTHPANMIMTIVPKAFGTLASFERIQKYLLDPTVSDQRNIPLQAAEDTQSAVSLDNVTVTSSSGQSLLENINIEIHAGSITVCSGPVGAGKSVLAKAIMGEMPVSGGSIFVAAKRIGYCSQRPWLPSTTVHEAVRGLANKDDDDLSWYNEVISACCLEEDISMFPQGHKTEIGSRGMKLSGGQRHRIALARCLYARPKVVVLDDSFSALDGNTEKQVVENLLGPQGLFKRLKTTVLLISNSAQYFHLADNIVILDRARVVEQGSWGQLKEKTEFLAKAILKNETEVNGESEELQDAALLKRMQQAADGSADLSRKTGDFSLYDYYFKAVGYKNLALMVLSVMVYDFFITVDQYWLKLWTQDGSNHTAFYASGYFVMALSAWLGTNVTYWSTFLEMGPQSSTVLHKRLLAIIIGAPLSFFASIDMGAILNRFSQDMQLIDNQMPNATQAVTVQTLKLLMQVALLINTQALLVLTLPVCIAIVYIIQKVYLQTSRQLRIIELESRSAVYLSFLETVDGISTIRAFGWQEKAQDINTQSLETSQRPYYLLFCLQRWLNIVLDMLVAVIGTSIIALAVAFKGTTTGGAIGMALNVLLVANTTLLRLVESWTTLEVSLGAISRLKALEKDTPHDDQPGETVEPDMPWPTNGSIEIKNVSVSYGSDVLALRNINLSIAGGQRIVLCGRTGSGKSTFLLTLLRIVDLCQGSITIDGIDLGTVPRSLIRRRCFITVPQDPFVIGQASLRFNLDPSETCGNEALISALKRSGLGSHFGDEDYAEILERPISTCPPLSHGQLQLFSLARALIKKEALRIEASGSYHDTAPLGDIKPILLLDEATSALDKGTELIIRRVLQEEFSDKGHTVIEISHRVAAKTGHVDEEQELVAWLANGCLERFGKAKDVLESN